MSFEFNNMNSSENFNKVLDDIARGHSIIEKKEGKEVFTSTSTAKYALERFKDLMGAESGSNKYLLQLRFIQLISAGVENKLLDTKSKNFKEALNQIVGDDEGLRRQLLEAIDNKDLTKFEAEYCADHRNQINKFMKSRLEIKSFSTQNVAMDILQSNPVDIKRKSRDSLEEGELREILHNTPPSEKQSEEQSEETAHSDVALPPTDLPISLEDQASIDISSSSAIDKGQEEFIVKRPKTEELPKNAWKNITDSQELPVMDAGQQKTVDVATAAERRENKKKELLRDYVAAKCAELDRDEREKFVTELYNNKFYAHKGTMYSQQYPGAAVFYGAPSQKFSTADEYIQDMRNDLVQIDLQNHMNEGTLKRQAVEYFGKGREINSDAMPTMDGISSMGVTAIGFNNQVKHYLTVEGRVVWDCEIPPNSRVSVSPTSKEDIVKINITKQGEATVSKVVEIDLSTAAKAGLPKEIQQLTTLATNFGAAISSDLLAKGTLSSPLNVLTCLEMLWDITPEAQRPVFAAAWQNTAGKQINPPMSYEEVHMLFTQVLPAYLESADIGMSSFIAANTGEDHVTISDSFREKNKIIDAGNSADLVTKVNSEVSRATQGMINTLISGANIDVAVVTALSFKREWAVQFDPSQTKEVPFTNIDGTKTSVSMMNHSKLMVHADIGYESGYEMLILPYAETPDAPKLRHVFVKPRQSRSESTTKEQAFNKMKEDLTPTSFKDLLHKVEGSEKKEMYISIPRMEQTASYDDLITLLGEKGFPIGELDPEKIKTDIPINGFVQKLTVKLDEKGGAAAAAAAAMATRGVTPTITMNSSFKHYIMLDDMILFEGEAKSAASFQPAT